MITAEELRIGNRIWPLGVADPQNIPLFGYVAGIEAIHGFLNNPWYRSVWAGIPLTEDRIYKMGFSLTSGFFQEPLYYARHSKVGEVKLYYHKEYKEPTFSLYDYPLRVYLEHVHQLQNLFFALTGEELQIPEE